MNEAERELLETVRRARAERRTVASAGEARGVDLAGAFRIQAALAAGRPVKGYKLGLVSPAKQRQMGIDRPIWGRVLPGMIHAGTVDLGGFLQPRLEPEVAAVLGDAIRPGARPGEVARAVAGFVLAVDILDSVWADYRFTLPEVVADNSSGGGFLLGSRLLPTPPPGELELWLDGERLARGPVSALGDPWRHLAWLAGETGGLEPGQVVFLGAPAAARPARPGTLVLISTAGVLSARLVDSRGEG